MYVYINLNNFFSNNIQHISNATNGNSLIQISDQNKVVSEFRINDIVITNGSPLFVHDNFFVLINEYISDSISGVNCNYHFHGSMKNNIDSTIGVIKFHNHEYFTKVKATVNSILSLSIFDSFGNKLSPGNVTTPIERGSIQKIDNDIAIQLNDDFLCVHDQVYLTIKETKKKQQFTVSKIIGNIISLSPSSSIDREFDDYIIPSYSKLQIIPDMERGLNLVKGVTRVGNYISSSSFYEDDFMSLFGQTTIHIEKNGSNEFYISGDVRLLNKDITIDAYFIPKFQLQLVTEKLLISVTLRLTTNDMDKIQNQQEYYQQHKKELKPTAITQHNSLLLRGCTNLQQMPGRCGNLMK